MPDKADGGKVTYVWFVGQNFKKTQHPSDITRARIEPSIFYILVNINGLSRLTC